MKLLLYFYQQVGEIYKCVMRLQIIYMSKREPMYLKRIMYL